MRIFDNRFIAVLDQAIKWEEAITYSGRLLLNEGKIEQSYIEAMIDNINSLGPYIIIAPKVALPHARPENGVNERGISVVVLKESVHFSSDDKHEVNLIVCLAATDSDSHLKLLQTISTWLSDEELLDQMMNVHTKKELDELLAPFYF